MHLVRFTLFGFLADYPGAFILLGAVFLCTTGAEALYSDLGHCGKNKYPCILDICKDNPSSQLFWSGCMGYDAL